MTWSRLLFLFGSLPFLLLGTAHAFATPLTRGSRKGLTPRDPDLPGAMARSAVLLTSRTDMWRAWVGFNLSHSLGAVGFGLFVLLSARTEAVYALQAPLALPLAGAITLVYLGLGLRYWFRTPIAGILLSLLAFGGACLLYLVDL